VDGARKENGMGIYKAIKKRKIAISLVAIVFLLANAAFADSCPYCGREYPDPMPGDEARVYELRRQHEEECRKRYEAEQESWDSGYGDSSYGGSYESAYQLEQERLEQQRLEQLRQQQMWQEQQAAMRRERMRLQEEAEKARLEEKKKQKAQFEKNKAKLASSLKGTPVKGLKIRDVPSPLAGPAGIRQGELRLKPSVSPATKKKAAKAYGVTRQAFSDSIDQTTQKLMDKLKSDAFKMTLGQIPGVSYVKSVYDKYKEMRQEMESLNMNIFQYAMHGMKEGVKRLATPYTSDGGFSEQYEEGRGGLFGRTFIKSRELLKKEIDSKSE